MSNIFFIADTHWNHSNIIQYCNRPFSNVEEMNKTMIDKWNAKVKTDDIVYHLGDFGFGDIRSIIKQLNGKIILIVGSHDKNAVTQCKDMFKGIYFGFYELRVEDLSITLCHYSLRRWPKSHYGTYHLFGHSHNHLPPFGKSFDIGVDCWNFEPLSLDEVKIQMDKLPENENMVKINEKDI
jgi:calcineurin-like phosphoesterase family protein